jgi:hypothetical protein
VNLGEIIGLVVLLFVAAFIVLWDISLGTWEGAKPVKQKVEPNHIKNKAKDDHGKSLDASLWHSIKKGKFLPL